MLTLYTSDANLKWTMSTLILFIYEGGEMSNHWIIKLLFCMLAMGCAACAQAELIEQDLDLPTCHLHLHRTDANIDTSRPLFVMMEGVPLSAMIYSSMALTIAEKLDAQSILVDFPGVGKSFLKGAQYGWPEQRECLRSYLSQLPPHVVVASDIALPVAAPLLLENIPIRGMVISNSVIKASVTKPPFPLSFFRCCPQVALFFSAITPGFILQNQIMQVGIGRAEFVDEAEISILSAEMQTHGFSGLAKIMTDIALDEATDEEISAGLSTNKPQLFLWGESDPALGDQYRYLPAFHDHQKLVLYQDGRHFLMLDHYQEMAAEIELWYKKQFSVDVNAQD